MRFPTSALNRAMPEMHTPLSSNDVSGSVMKSTEELMQRLANGGSADDIGGHNV
jgi:hypothetical protein